MALNIPTEGTKLNELKINIVDTQETFEAMKTANKVNANELYFIEQELPITANSLKTGHTFKVNLASNNASTAFNGTADITDIGVSGTLPVKHGGTGFTTATYKNAVVIGNNSTVTNQLQTVRTASGAFYATGQDGKPSFGTLPVAQGGTGQTSIANIQAGKDSAGNTITSTYLKLSGGNMTGHIYLTGSQANSSTANTSQLIFGTPTTEHIAISSNTKALILNPAHNSTTNQIVLYLDKASTFPFGIEANITGNLTGKATTAGTADIANSVAWNNVSSKPTTFTPATHTHGPSDLTGLKTLTIGSNSCQVFANADINIPITVDTALSSTSTNPVQNKIVNSALNKKLNKSGGTLTGAITTNGIKLTSGTDFGSSLPSSLQSNQLFFQTLGSNYILDNVYPVGSIYMSVNSTNPQNLFGGTWEQIQGKFLFGMNSSYPAGSTGGEITHKLTNAEMPAHAHYMASGNSGAPDTWTPDSGSYLVDSVTNDKHTWWAQIGMNEAGGGAAHNNMPPYLSVYIWKRTA